MQLHLGSVIVGGRRLVSHAITSDCN